MLWPRFYPATIFALGSLVLVLGCGRSSGLNAPARAAPETSPTATVDSDAVTAANPKAVNPEYAKLQAKGAELAAMSRDERRAKWPTDDPTLKQAPWIRALLPEISKIRSVTAITETTATAM
jgi:hypothetical protein